MGRAKLDDPELRLRICDLIRAGCGRHEAVAAVGLDQGTFRRYYKANADFRDEIEDAVEHSIEPMVKMLRNEGLAGDITAAKEYMKHMAVPRSEAVKQEHTLKIELDETVVSSINDLRARLAGRTAPELEAPEEIEDAEIIEED